VGKKLKTLVTTIIGGGGEGKSAKAAADAQARAAASAEAARIAQENMQRNFAADLKQENVGSVVAGGTADITGIDAQLKKKKSAAGGLASALGINV